MVADVARLLRAVELVDAFRRCDGVVDAIAGVGNARDDIRAILGGQSVSRNLVSLVW